VAVSKPLGLKAVRLASEPEFRHLLLLAIQGKRGQTNKLAARLRAKGYSYRLMQAVANAIIKNIEQSLSAASVAAAGKKKGKA